jgi:DNA-binding XRE family transcriptional regulator
MAQEEIIFPNNIRNIRLSAGMKMTELARRTGLSLSAVSKIEKGVRRLNQKQLLNIWKVVVAMIFFLPSMGWGQRLNFKYGFLSTKNSEMMDLNVPEKKKNTLSKRNFLL